MTQPGSTQQALDSRWPRDVVHARVKARQIVLKSYEMSAVGIGEYMQQVVDFAESNQESQRRAVVQRRVDIMEDAWGPLLKASMENWCTPEVADAVMGAGRDHLDLSRNPAKHIWEELSVLYRLPPVRTSKTKSDDKAFHALIDGTGYDQFWQAVERYLNACNEVLVWPDVVTDSSGKRSVKHRFAAGNVVTLVCSDDDPTFIEAVVIHCDYYDRSGARVKRYKVWTDQWHQVVERGKDGKLLPVGRVPDEPADAPSYLNPYKRLHFHLLRLQERDDSIWDTTSGEDLVDLTLRLGEERLWYRYLQKMGGFKQGVVTGDDAEVEVPQFLLDPGALIKLFGSSMAFQVVDWTVDLKARLDCMQADELAAAAARGINPERYKRTANYQGSSAAARAERGLAERRIRVAPVFKVAEAVYAEHLVAVARAHGMQDLPKDGVRVDVMHAPIEYPEDPREQAELDKTRIALGLDSAVSIVKREHPTWSEDECLAHVEKNLENTARVNDMKTRHMVPDNPENRSSADEQAGAMGTVVRDNPNPMQNPPGTPPGDQTGDRGKA